MNTTVTFNETEVKDIIRQHLRSQGFEVDGEIKITVSAGYEDRMSFRPASLSGISAKVKPASVSHASGFNSLAHQIDAVESGHIVPR